MPPVTVASAPAAASPLLRGSGLPDFEAITPEMVSRDIPLLLEQLDRRLADHEVRLKGALESDAALGWDEVMEPLERIGEHLRWSWGVVGHLMGVRNSPELREAHRSQQADVVQFSNRMAQSRALYDAICRLDSQDRSASEGSPQQLDATQRRILAAERRDMEQRGVGLDGAEREAFNSASQELAALSTRFSNNVLDATDGWSLTLRRREEVDGLPDSLLALLADAAQRAGERAEDGSDPSAEHGPWRLGLDMPRYVPFLTYSRRRDLREAAYRAYVSRASSGEQDNSPLIEQILSLRGQQARRLGTANWADLSLTSKMAGGVNEVEGLLEDLRRAAHPVALEELDDLRACAGRHGADEAGDLQPWDVAFWAEALRRERFDLDREALRPWFPLPRVLDGLFALSERLFSIRLVAADGQAPVWHPDVRFFHVLDRASGERLAAFYLDPYSRPGQKRGGAWMDDCLGRSLTPAGEPVLPVAYLICNQTPPLGDTPSLMTFEEVETLFHEFGHGLQHMLTTVERPQAAGINNVEWDAVELPSQFMENWCYDRPTLSGMARHWQTGAPLAEADMDKLLAARTFMAGNATLRQVHFALTDLRLHRQWSPDLGISPDELRRRVAETTTVLGPIPEDRFLCSFGHIFAGGYSAGYYAYKWAEVLSADAFAAFEEVGLENEEELQQIGRRFRDTVLSLGGSRSPSEVFCRFRGREPRADALIRHSGLVRS
ncbi:M3 family peptidase [Synechococcus sp. RSCCF101]|uniref:M3 family metallopeptidase n=1 Tax=Synechococcus sp. RSCCF101 TaxID=2511069 RepID=UPI0012449153|nr:M3 family metallopeptidase [Synechococcus sp. RSCCF101]QEY31419.1 M3 family peptidase [Synechococcus sp. RSCCF101]